MIRLSAVVASLSVLAGQVAFMAPAVVQAHDLGGPAGDGLLTSPPNDARAGECYAKVVAPGQPIAPPPSQPRAVWVLSPPPPGVASPIWCLQFLPGPQQPVRFTPERYGWIRVICDKDATPERIRHVQRRLHDWGYYDGGYDGKYGEGVAAAVTRFQERRHIEHGGYLSYRTMEALDEQAPAPQPTYSAPAQVYAYGGGLAYGGQAYGASYAQTSAYVQQSYAPVQQPIYQQPSYQQVCGPACLPPPPQPCCAQAPVAYGGGYGGQWAGQWGRQPGSPGAPYKGWLNWSGKASY